MTMSDDFVRPMTILEITYESKDVVDIMVMGEFNNWRPLTMDMRFEDNKLIYFVNMEVPIGFKYRFQFLIDGEIKTDPRQPESESTLLERVTNYIIV
jgi:hypothetical protein